MIEIKNIQGNVIYSTEINKGAKRKFQLMKEDYITLLFSFVNPVDFGLGCYAEIDGGIFEVTTIQKPTLNNSTGGYDYQLRLDAYYWKWKNKIFKFTPEVGGQEASWSLTASLDVHLGIFLRNLKALGYTYRGSEFEFSIDATVENKAVALTYENTNMIDALSAMAEAFQCEWWVIDNIIHFGRCEYGTPVDFEIGNNVAEMTRSESQSSYATRLYVFGSTRNIPSSYRPVDESIVVNGVVQRRLMLPEGIPYIDAYEGMSEEEAIEEVVILDDIYPKTDGKVSSVTTYDDTVENEDGTENTETFYRFTDNSITFSSDYILEGEELKAKFTSGSLNGMEFGLAFNPNGAAEKNEDGSWNSEAQLFEVVANEDYGRKLPDSTLHPKVGDTYILIGWDSSKIADLGLVSKAEQELYQEGLKISAKRKIDPSTYGCKMFSDYMFGLDSEGSQDESYRKTFEVGDRVNLINDAYFKNGRQSRIIGYEYNLDYPFDSPIYQVGETASYSRLGALESKLDSLTFKGQTYSGGNGSGVYVIGTNDATKPTDRNVFSALKSQKEFLSKTRDDRSKGLIASDKGFEVGRFVSGASGAIIYKDSETGQTIGELDKLYVRMKAYFDTLVISEVDTISGKQIISPAGSIKCIGVDELKNAYRCYFLGEQDGSETTNLFHVNDQAYSQTFNAKQGEYNKLSNTYYWRLITDVSKDVVTYKNQKCHYIDLSKTDCDNGSDIPKEGDIINHRGSRTEIDRMNFIESSSVDAFSPNITLFHGVNSYSLDGKDYVSYGVDKTTNKAYMNVYGDMFVGDRNGSTYMRYTPEEGLVIKGKLDIETKLGDATLKDLISASTPEGYQEFVEKVTQDIEGLQQQMDGAIESYFYQYEPTLNNYPASDWDTKELKDAHLNDTFTNLVDGRSWRWTIDNGIYKWTEITDTATTQALALAGQAKDTADGKRRVFVEQPKTPYDKGDLWSRGKDYPFLICVNAKGENGSFAQSDWDYADNSEKIKQEMQELVGNTKDELNNSIGQATEAANTYTDTAKQALQDSINELNKAKANINDVYTKSEADGVISQAEADAISAAKQQADAAIALSKVTIKAYADGVVDAEESARIKQAQENLAEAKKYAEQKAQEALDDALSSLSTFDYLKSALKEDTSIEGGLIQSSLIKLGYTSSNTFKVMSGTNGIYNTSLIGGGIASWWGGDTYDLMDYYTWDGTKWVVKSGVSVPSNIPSGLIRFDGTGYFAKGKFWWDANGEIHADPTALLLSFDASTGDETLASTIVNIRKDIATFLDMFEVRKDGDGKEYLYSKRSLVTNGGVTMYANVGDLNIPSIYNGLPIDGSTIYWENGVLKALNDGGVASSVAWDNITGKPNFASVATSGKYDDLIGKPTLLSSFTNDLGFIDSSALSGYLPLTGGTMKGSITFPSGTYILNGSNAIFGIDTDGVLVGHWTLPLLFRCSVDAKINGNTICHSGNYSNYALPLSGGTLSGNLTITNTSTTQSRLHLGSAGSVYYDEEGKVISLYNGGSGYSAIQIKEGLNYPIFRSNYVDNKIWHSGNLKPSDYLLASTYTASDVLSKILTVDGEGSGLDADTLDGYHSTAFTQFYIDRSDNFLSYTNRTRFQTSYIAGQGDFCSLVIPTWTGNNANNWYLTELRFAIDGGLKIRASKAGNVEYGWKTIATTDSNVDSATKLKTPRTIWGRLFDGTSDIEGSLYVTNSNAIYIQDASGTWLNQIEVSNDNALNIGYSGGVQGYTTTMYGGNIIFKVGTSRTEGMRLTSTGNVLIGTTTDSGYKLDVDGTGFFNIGAFSYYDGLPSFEMLDESPYVFHISRGKHNNYGFHLFNYETGASFIQTGRPNLSTQKVLPLILNFFGGNVGIGASSKPQYTLDVVGDIRSTTNVRTPIATIDGISIYKSQDDVLYIDGNLVVRGGVTMFGESVVDIPTFMESIVTDETNLKVIDGVLTFVGRTGGGEADSVLWDNITNKPSWITTSKPSYSYSEISGRPTKLSELTDDVVSGNYLHLSGGAIVGNAYAPFSIKRKSNAGVTIGFFNTNGTLGYIGVNSSGIPIFEDTTSVVNHIWHSGNFTPSNYLLASTYTASDILTKLKTVDGAGSGLDADLLDGKDGSWYLYNVLGFARLNSTNNNYSERDANSVINGMLYNYGSPTYWKNAPSNFSFGQILSLSSGNNASLMGQLAWDIYHNSSVDTTRTLWWRGITNEECVTYAKWHQIAFTDSNVASATKLETPRTIWGQSFDGSGDVSGHLNLGYFNITNANGSVVESSSSNLIFGKGNAVAGFPTYLDGNELFLRYGKTNNIGLKITNSGNVLIGTTTDSGYKLDVVENTTDKIFKVSGSNNTFRITSSGIGAYNHTNGGWAIYAGSASNESARFEVIDKNGTWTGKGWALFHNGNMSIGTVIDSGYKLDVAGDIKTSTSLIVGSSASGNILMMRPSMNYIWANVAGGSIHLGVRDFGGVSDNNASLSIYAKNIRPGFRDNSVSLGVSDIRWSNIYSVKATIDGIPIYKSQDGVLYIEGNLAVKGGITMYAEDEVNIPSIIDSLPIAGYTSDAKGIAAFNPSDFVITDGVVSYIGTSSGVDESFLYNYLTTNDYAKKDDFEGKYLPLSGGDMTGRITFKNGSSAKARVGWSASSGVILYSNATSKQMGIRDDGLIYVYDDGVHNIWHAGNFEPSDYQPLINNSNKLSYSLISGTPTSLSSFTNDSGYITSSALSGYATESFVTGKGYIENITNVQATVGGATLDRYLGITRNGSTTNLSVGYAAHSELLKAYGVSDLSAQATWNTFNGLRCSYFAASASNIPASAGSNANSLITFMPTWNYGFQIACLNSLSSGYDSIPHLYFRNFVNGSYKSWHKIVTNGPQMKFEGVDWNYPYIGIRYQENDWYYIRALSNGLWLGRYDTYGVRIDSSGNVVTTGGITATDAVDSKYFKSSESSSPSSNTSGSFRMGRFDGVDGGFKMQFGGTGTVGVLQVIDQNWSKALLSLEKSGNLFVYGNISSSALWIGSTPSNLPNDYKLHVSGAARFASGVYAEGLCSNNYENAYPKFRLISDQQSNAIYLQAGVWDGSKSDGVLNITGMYNDELDTLELKSRAIIISHGDHVDSWIKFAGHGSGVTAVSYGISGSYISGALVIYNYTSSSVAMQITGNNLLVAGGITMYSDQRKKTILGNVELSLKDIANAPLVEHYYNTDESKTTHVGSIAQYWYGLNDWFCKKDNEGFLTMEIQNAALASAISIARELDRYESKTDKTIKQLKKRICQLEEEIEQLKSA